MNFADQDYKDFSKPRKLKTKILANVVDEIKFFLERHHEKGLDTELIPIT